MNTAIIIYITTDMEDWLGTDHIKQVAAILWADALTTPTMRLLDIGSTFKKYVLAPRAKTQKKMNSYFTGTLWTLAEVTNENPKRNETKPNETKRKSMHIKSNQIKSNRIKSNQI